MSRNSPARHEKSPAGIAGEAWLKKFLRPYFRLARVSLIFSKFGSSLGVGVCSLY